MEVQASANQIPNNNPKNGPQVNQKKARKRKQLQHSADIVYTRGTSIQTMPSLSTQLKGIMDSVIGLQYVWEYRSPSKSVPPHYQCKLCAVSRLQHDMLAHVKGWKHNYRYMKKAHPDKVTWEEEEATKDPAVRKMIKEAAAEVMKTEGRGQLKVILKEPYDVPAFKGLRSAVPKVPPPHGKGPNGLPFDHMFPDHAFPGEFRAHEGPFSDCPLGDFGAPGFGGFQHRQGFSDGDMDRRPLPGGMGRHPGRLVNDFGSDGGRDSYRSGLMEEDSGQMYPDDYRGCQMGSRLMDRPVNKPLDGPGMMRSATGSSSSQSNALLSYLDTFHIENENDAQLVLKVTQKLTDALMDYRLRSVSAGSSMDSLSMSSTSFSPSPSRLPSSGARYSSPLSNLSAGPSRFSGGPNRY